MNMHTHRYISTYPFASCICVCTCVTVFRFNAWRWLSIRLNCCLAISLIDLVPRLVSVLAPKEDLKHGSGRYFPETNGTPLTVRVCASVRIARLRAAATSSAEEHHAPASAATKEILEHINLTTKNL